MLQHLATQARRGEREPLQLVLLGLLLVARGLTRKAVFGAVPISLVNTFQPMQSGGDLAASESESKHHRLRWEDANPHRQSDCILCVGVPYAASRM